MRETKLVSVVQLYLDLLSFYFYNRVSENSRLESDKFSMVFWKNPDKSRYRIIVANKIVTLFMIIGAQAWIASTNAPDVSDYFNVGMVPGIDNVGKIPKIPPRQNYSS